MPLHYVPLRHDLDEIRLLTLLPSPPNDSPSSPVRCTLGHFSLAALSHGTRTGNLNNEGNRFPWGDYAALSYVWGPSTPEAYIEVNTQPVRVTRNLEVALRHLRNAPDNNENKLRFWIDAVCIDQSSTRERSTEVARMGRIYSSARRVVCWLGPAFAGVDVALGTVRDLERVAGSEVEFLSPWNSSAQKRVVTGEAIRGLYEMLRRPYWSRLWIVQEVALGAQDTGGEVVVVCGDGRVPLDSVVAAARFVEDAFVNLREELVAELGEDGTRELSGLAWRVAQIGNIRGEAAGKETVSIRHVDAVVRLGMHAAVTDPRDKVYGLLGLLGPRFAAEMAPDYDLKTQEVYADFTRACIAVFGNLNVMVLSSSRQEGWPSWVPDLETPAEVDGAVLHTSYRAGGENPLDLTFSADGRLLYCYGIRVDIGSRPVLPAQDALAESQRGGTRRRGLLDANRYGLRAGRRLANEDASLSRFWATMAQTPSASSPQEEDLLRGLREIPSPRGHEHAGAPGSLEWVLGQRDDWDLSLDNPQVERTVTNSMRALEEMDMAIRSLGQRTMAAFTAQNQFVWAYEPLSEKDVVCLLLGCSYPVILRPKGRFSAREEEEEEGGEEEEEQFEIVSECYIYEIMDGQGLERLGEDGTELERFCIC